MIITATIIFFTLGTPIYNEIKPREGQYKKIFKMYKFRTKRLNTRGLSDELSYTKITKFVDILRLNELPQLFNILRGEMSFVGPRPFIPGETLPAGEISEKRYLVKPGVTGLAQVKNGRLISHKMKLKYDIEYYDNLSFCLDLQIIIKTPLFIIKNLVIYLKTLRKKS